VIKAEREFVELVREYVEEYEKANKRPVSLNIVNRRWGVRCKEALGGVSIKDLILKHKRVFRTEIGVTGGLMLRAEKSDRLLSLIELYLKSAERPLTEAELLESLRGSGYTMSEFIERAIYMQEIGLLSVSEGVYRILED
jgi:hypothetical protein